MVFFTCNACNESLKKNQVEKHYTTKCRQCEYLSCIDCGKDFWGDTYQSHTKCVSEEEKYSGKNFVAKPNKGEVKQEQWIQKVQSAIQKASSNPQLKSLLLKLEEYPNVPRKKAKFENFLKCSLRVINKGLVNQVWDLLMAETQQQNGNSTASEGDSKPQASTSPVESAKSTTPTETAEAEDNETEKKLNKRERKENRKKKAHKAEKKDKQASGAVAEEAEEKDSKKKGKRRRRDEDENEDEEGVENGFCEKASEPKKKKRKGENGVAMETEQDEEDGDGEESLTSEKKGKFNWGLTITAVLEAKGEISVKRLQKKVLAEYASYGSSKPEEKVLSKFNRKLRRLPSVRVLKDKAKLIQS